MLEYDLDDIMLLRIRSFTSFSIGPFTISVKVRSHSLECSTFVLFFNIHFLSHTFETLLRLGTIKKEQFFKLSCEY